MTSAPKSLLIVRDYFPPQVGGISRMMAEIATVLGPQKICCLSGIEGPRELPTPGGPVKVYRSPQSFFGSSARQALGLSGSLPRIFARERPRLVQLATCAEGSLGLLIEQTLRVPFVMYAHGNEVLEAKATSWDKPRRAFRSARAVFAVSRYTAGIVRELGVDPRRIQVLGAGVDTRLFRPQPPDAELRRAVCGPDFGGSVLLTIGNLVERKGHDMVIRSLPRLARELGPVRYVIVGSGPHRDTLERLVASVGVGELVHFVGQIPDTDLPRYHALADLFVMPSRLISQQNDVEGFGLVYLEANACGKPVVGGTSGGMAEAIVTGETGLVTDGTDVEAVASALRTILRDCDLARRMGEKGRRRVLEEYSWRVVGARLERALADALA